MKKKGLITAFAASLILFTSCGVTVNASGPVQKQFTTAGTVYTIKNDIDLANGKLMIPEGCTLVFKGGKFRNGTLVGNGTRIKSKTAAFDNVQIEGSWNVPEIRTSLFTAGQKDLLENMFHLQGEGIHNEIFVEEGRYTVSANNSGAALRLTSNTSLHIDGEISLEKQTNDKYYNGYYILLLKEVNEVTIDGNGILKGDKGISDIKGEYGHCICILGCDNISVSGLTLRSPNGDGVAVSVKNKKISLSGLTIEDYYRNGVSLVSCTDFLWTDSVVKNGGGMDPYAAIDIEPNPGSYVGNAVIRNIQVDNCVVGIGGYSSTDESVSTVENAIFENINLTNISKEPIAFSGMKKLSLNNISINEIKETAKYIVRILACREVEMNKVTIVNKYDNLKFPLYLNNDRLTIKNCHFTSPTLFSYHLSNVTIEDSYFEYDSFVQTSMKLTTDNLKAKNSTFVGEFSLRPQNVDISDCKFILPDNGKANNIDFGLSVTTKLKEPTVRFEGNEILVKGRSKDSISGTTLPNSVIKNNKFVKE